MSLTSPTVRVLVIAYQAESTLADTLDRIPGTVAGRPTSLVVADDASTDRTEEIARAWAAGRSRPDVEVVRRHRNLGYGGNQIAGYRAAIDDGVDIVVVLHGDGQYPPEALDEIVAPIVAGDADAVFGSRMLSPGGARRGGMPLNRYLGNRGLSAVQNLLTGERLSEWHSGFHAYRTSSLDAVSLETLTTGFDFDTAITLRLLDIGARIREVAISTHYGAEVSHIDLYATGWRILRQTLARRLGLPSSKWHQQIGAVRPSED